MLSPKISLNAVKSFSDAAVIPIYSGKGTVPGLRYPKKCNLIPKKYMFLVEQYPLSTISRATFAVLFLLLQVTMGMESVKLISVSQSSGKNRINSLIAKTLKASDK